MIPIEGGEIPIRLLEDPEGEFLITIDNVEWASVAAYHHAVILFEILADHITEYMHYEKR